MWGDLLSSESISLIISIAAIFISIYGIISQNRGIVFEHRLSIYTKTIEIHNQCLRITQLCPSRGIKSQRKLIAIILFAFNSQEVELSEEYLQERANEKDPLTLKETDLLTKYVSLYTSNNSYHFLDRECEIFFDKQIYSCAKDLYFEYNDLAFSFLLLSEDQLNEKYKKLEKILFEFQSQKILNKMKKKLPIC